MKGLLIKDFYMIKDGLLIPALTMVVFGVVLSVIGSIWVLPVIAAVSLGMQAVLTLSMDKSSQWYKFARTLPVSNAQFVASKYALYLLFSVMGLVLGTLIAVIASALNGGFSLEPLLVNCCLAIVMSFLPGSVNIPCSFLFSEEKGIAGIIISLIAAAGIYVGLRTLLGHFIDLEMYILMTHTIIAALSLVIYLLSCAICPKILRKQEL